MIPWLDPGADFPDVNTACAPDSAMPGLVAVGGSLDSATLERAYRAGIFPWFSEGQPILWWSPDPRMVLQPSQFRVHRSFRRRLRDFLDQPRAEVRVDTAFAEVIEACAHSPRRGQHGTWILPQMQHAYVELHRHGMAHSVEVWLDETLVGGLYCVALGHAVFGESMFSRESGASRIALAALVSLCRQQGVEWIDCQQETAHLALLGARTMPRAEFCRKMQAAQREPPLQWEFQTVYWNDLLSPSHP